MLALLCRDSGGRRCFWRGPVVRRLYTHNVLQY